MHDFEYPNANRFLFFPGLAVVAPWPVNIWTSESAVYVRNRSWIYLDNHKQELIFTCRVVHAYLW